MSKYYKAEDVLAIFSEEERPLNWTDSEGEIQAQNDFEYYKGMIASLPTIDIVHCYYCKHYREEDVGVGDYQWCELLQREVEIDWYCASGERIEE